MKNFLFIALFLSLIIGGCEDKPELSTKPDGSNKAEWIKLPAKVNSTLEKVFYVEKSINGQTGGEILLDASYAGGPLGTVYVYSKIIFPPNSFNGTVNFTMTVSDDEAVLIFEPSMVFNLPAILDVRFEGLDLTGIDPAAVSFYYKNDDGSVEYVDRNTLTVDVRKGKLHLDDAIIPHFTRLGFTR
ncbi:MAG: hypothetical protein IPM56_06605 [Ignavibacteriales bacterium]|nr:MAG: hypothetical protein IPM56_06605 [Ignavibacteriales bacterium]